MGIANAVITPTIITTIKQQLANDNIIAAGDGSVKHRKGAQAWSIFRKDTHEISLRGALIVIGDPLTMTSMRPETVSSIAAGTFLNMIAQPLQDLNAHVIFYSDSESIVKNSQRSSPHDVGTVLENDIDVTIQNMRLIKKIHFLPWLSACPRTSR